jgi:hypothetical protein
LAIQRRPADRLQDEVLVVWRVVLDGRHGGHLGAGDARQLDCDHADAAAGAGDEDGAAEQVAAEADQVERGAAGHREGGGRGEADVVGQRHGAVLGHRGQRRPAVPVRQAHDALALSGSGRHDAGDLLARAEVLAHLHQRELAAVDAGGVDADEQLAGSRLGLGHLAQLRPALAARRRDDRLH